VAVLLETKLFRWRGLSTDTKPSSGVPQGSTFNEIDTGNKFVYQDEQWLEDLSGPVKFADFEETEARKRRLAESQYLKSGKSIETDGHYNFTENR